MTVKIKTETCIRCEHRLTLVQRIFRRDGFCSDACKIEDAAYISQLAWDRLQEPVLYDCPTPQPLVIRHPVLHYKGLTLLSE